MKVVVLATDPTEGDLLRQTLMYAGLEVESHINVAPVLANWSESAADLVVFSGDREVDPVARIHQIREVTHMPLMIIVQPISEITLCEMLQAGADLVLMRPVGARVILNYARVLLRRVDTVPQSLLNAFSSDKFSLDPEKRTVTIEGSEPRRLTRLEFQLLYVLVVNREKVVPTDTLIERVWGYESRGDSDLLRGLISRVRQKVEPDQQNPQYIETLQGVGYRFTLEGPISP